MIKYVKDYTALIHVTKANVNASKQKIVYYFDGKIETVTFADSGEFDDAVAALDGFLVIGTVYYNKNRLSVATQIGAVVTYEREGHDEDLPFVRGVGQTLLVSAHSCRENNFAEGIGTVAEGFTFVHGSVLEDKVTASHRGYSIVKPYLIIGVSKKHPIIGRVRNRTLGVGGRQN